MNELQIFSFEDREVRTVQKDNETWWVAQDICEVFGETNRNRAMQTLDEDEKGYTQMTTPGGTQQLAVVTEAGLFALLFAMQPTKARGVSEDYITNREQKLRKFKRWVTHEVLPSIRKHGAYLTPEKIEEVLLNPDTIITLARQLKQANEEKARLAADLHEKTLQLDESKEWLTVKRVAVLNNKHWRSFDWRLLKNASRYLELPVRKVFDPNLGQVNAYHIDAWKYEYSGHKFS